MVVERDIHRFSLASRQEGGMLSQLRSPRFSFEFSLNLGPREPALTLVSRESQIMNASSIGLAFVVQRTSIVKIMQATMGTAFLHHVQAT